MSRYVPSLRAIELEEDDEPLMSQHFAHARRAWAMQEEVLDNAYTCAVVSTLWTKRSRVYGAAPPAFPSVTTSGPRAYWKRGVARAGCARGLPGPVGSRPCSASCTIP